VIAPESRESGALEALGALLSGGDAVPIVRKERAAPSTMYDLRYRLAIEALAFMVLAKDDGSGVPRVRAAELKLVQFISIRPWLLRVVESWSLEHSGPQLSFNAAQRLRRGFLGDTMHDDLVQYLVASGVLGRHGSHVTAGARAAVLASIAERATALDLFAAERSVMIAFRGVKITNRMLEGW
jgi:hypothetical protein